VVLASALTDTPALTHQRSLQQHEHCCAAVVDRDNRILLGTVLRKTLLVLLAQRHWAQGSVEDSDMPEPLPVLPLLTIEKEYPVYPRLVDVEISTDDARCLLDLAPYVQIGPYTMNEHASAHR
jgi:hypothetical protein